jgi:hypothetical protein
MFSLYVRATDLFLHKSSFASAVVARRQHLHLTQQLRSPATISIGMPMVTFPGMRTRFIPGGILDLFEHRGHCRRGRNSTSQQQSRIRVDVA